MATADFAPDEGSLPTQRDEVLIRPSFEREGFWCVACTCGLEQADHDYRATYAAADRHRSAHNGEGLFGPRAPGGVIALSPDTPADVLATTHELWLNFYTYCRRWQQNYPPAGDRTDDPEAWLNFRLSGHDRG